MIQKMNNNYRQIDIKKSFYILSLILFLFTLPLSAQEEPIIEKVISFSVSGITPIGIFAEDWNIGGGAYLGYG